MRPATWFSTPDRSARDSIAGARSSPHRAALVLAIVLLAGVTSGSVALAGQTPPPTGASALRCIPIEQALSPFPGPPTTQDPRHIVWVGAKEPPVSYTAAVSGEIIDAGKPVEFTLTVKNTGDAPATFSFSTAQRFDVVIWNDDCAEMWRWSRGRMFAQVLGSLSLPAGGTTTFKIPWNQRDQAGHPVRIGAYEARMVFVGTWAKRTVPLVLSPLVFAVR